MKGHHELVWKNIQERVRRKRCLAFPEKGAKEIHRVLLAPLGAVVTSMLRLVNDHSFDQGQKVKKAGVNADTCTDEVPPCPCANALQERLAELTGQIISYPTARILMTSADASGSFP